MRFYTLTLMFFVSVLASANDVRSFGMLHSTKLDNGWFRAASTEGFFAVNVPGAYNDFSISETKNNEDDTSYINQINYQNPKENLSYTATCSVGQKIIKTKDSLKGYTKIEYNKCPGIEMQNNWISNGVKMTIKMRVFWFKFDQQCVLASIHPKEIAFDKSNNEERFFNTFEMPLSKCIEPE